MKQKSFIVIILLCVLLTSCGTQEESPSKSIATSTSAVVATENDAIIEYATEEHPEDYFDDYPSNYDEKLDYGEVYNNNGITIKTTDFVHEKKDCYVEVEIFNNSGKNLIFNEKSYSVNYCNFSGTNPIIDHKYNDNLYKITLNNGTSGKAKLRIRGGLAEVTYQIVTDIRFLFYAYDKDTKELYEKIYFGTKTDKDDGIAHFREHPVVCFDDYFSYQLNESIHQRNLDRTVYSISIYNKTDKWLRIDLRDVYINDILATEEDDRFYRKVADSPYGVKSSADYYATETDDDSLYLFPNSKNCIMLFINDDFLDNNDFESINKVKLQLKYYINDMDKYSVESTVEFNPNDYDD